MTYIIIAAVTGCAASALLTYLEIPFLKRHQFKQYIREEGPKSHQSKSGTPTMGGIAIVVAMLAVVLIMNGFPTETLVMLAVMMLFALIGFLDDFIKVAEKHNLGLRAWQKLVLQIMFGIGLAIYMSVFADYGTSVYIPFIDRYIDFGTLYIPFVTFVIVAMANSVNLTDGLDGLCAGVTAIVSLFFALVGYDLMQKQPAVFCAVLAGVCVGFLIFNRHPAKLFMGDTGSMALGGALGAAAIMMKMEFLLVLAGLIYVLEALSVIIQVVSFKATGRRVFKMAPIHHHFEMCGMKEVSVVLMFWGFAFVCCVVAYLIYSL